MKLNQVLPETQQLSIKTLNYSFELLTKQLGTELKIEETNSIVVYYFQVNSEVILLMLENTTGKTKNIKFELQFL